MESETDTQLTISKWPFYLGDAFLVGVAITIGSLSNWQLTDLQVAYCVVAVALGSGLFVLPYIVEYSMRYRELAEDRDGQLRVFMRQLQQIEQASMVQAEQILALSDTKRAGANSEPLLTAALEQLTKLQTAQASASEDLANLKLELADLSKGNQSDGDAGAENNKASEEALTFAQQSIENLQSQLSDLVKRTTSLQVLEERLTKIEMSSGSSSDPSASSEAQVSNEAKAKKESKRTAEPQSRLLKRAIVEKKDPDSSAVDRIIDSKVESKDSEATTVQDSSEQDEQQEQEMTLSEEPIVVMDVPLDEVEKEDFEESMHVEVDLEENGDDDVGAAIVDIEEQPITAPVVNDSLEQSEVSPAEEVISDQASEPDLLLDSASEENVSVPSKKRSKKADTVVRVHALIGIGNKPYIRGSGGGLNWEQGVVMDFQEIGKWRWEAPAEVDSAIEVQIYCNDEDPDKQGKQTIQPGENLEIESKF
jgi:hypothetical protein